MRLLVLLLAALTAACALPETGAPPGPPNSETPHFTVASFVADDGAYLPMRSWLPAPPLKTKAVILALHGFNDYSNSFKAPGEDWAKDGIATYAIDQRGFGAAPDHGLWAGAPRMAADAEEASVALHARYPGVPLYLLGESMGGAVAIVTAAGTEGTPVPPLDGLILEAPAVWGRDTMNVFERVALYLAYHTVPAMTLTGRGLGIKPSDNIPMLRALGRDPLVIKETRVDTIKGLVDLMDDATAAAPRLTEPMLFLYGERDELIPRGATEHFLEALSPETPRTLAYYPAGYHMLLRDLEAAVVWRDVEAWIDNPEAPLPSGADRNAEAKLLPRH